MKDEEKNIEQLLMELKELRDFIKILEQEKIEFTDSLPEIVFETDDKGNIIFVNRQFEIELGYKKQDIGRGFNIGHLVILEDIQRAFEHFMMTVMEKETRPFEGTALRKDESTFSIAVYPKIFKRENKVAGMRGFVINTTEQKKAQKALYESEERLSLAVKAASLGIWDWDILKKISIRNNKMFEIYGIQKENPIRYKIWAKTVIQEDLAEAKAAIHRIITNKGDGFIEFRIIKPDGNVRHIQAGLSAITNESGDVYRLVGINMDITERKKYEEERENLISQLQETLLRVKQLSGLLPICCKCKKIRNGDGSWSQIEAYIHEHSEARFSHGLCEECLQELYPDFS